MVVDRTMWELNAELHVHPTFMELNSKKGNVAGINANRDITEVRIMPRTNIKVFHIRNELFN